MLKRIINLGAVYYTAISGVFLLFAQLFGDNNTGLDPGKFLFLLLFAFIMSTGTAIKESNLMNKIPAAVCHAACYVGGFFFCVILPYHKGFTFSVISTAIFAVLYGIACLIKSFIINRKSEKKVNAKSQNTKNSGSTKKSKKQPETQTEYKSLFSDDK